MRVRASLSAIGVMVLALLAVVVLPSAPAGAHAFLAASDPADGSRLASAPKQLRLDFSESVVLEATRVDLTDGAGHHLAPTSLRLDHLGAADDTESPSHLVATLPPLARGAYRVSWRTLSADDLHQTQGVLVFGVGAAVRTTPFTEPAPRAEEAGLRWLLFGGLAVSLGGLLLAALHRRAGVDGRGPARSRRLSAAGAAVGLLASGGLLIDQLVLSHMSVGRLLSGSYGLHWGLREAGLAVLLLAPLDAVTRRMPRPAHAAVAVAGVAAACVGSALLGHSGASGPTRAGADALHLAAAATWVGTVLVAAAVLLRPLRRGGRDAARARAVLRGFRVPAVACVVTMTVTGVYLISGVVGSVDAALLTTYGRVLLLKLAAVAVVGLLGAVTSMRVHASRPRRSPRRTLLAEAVLGLAVLGLAAALTAGQPAREPQFVDAAHPPTVPVVTSAVADLQESLALRPNLPGRSVALVDVFDTRRPVLAPVRRVLVAIAGPGGQWGTPVAAEPLVDSRWSIVTGLAAPGRTLVRVTVQRDGLPDTVHDFTWMVGGAPVRTRTATVSTAPIRDTAVQLSAVLAALALAGSGIALGRWAARRRRGEVSVPAPATEQVSELADA